VKGTSIIRHSWNWHRKEQGGVNENKNLPIGAEYSSSNAACFKFVLGRGVVGASCIMGNHVVAL